jgi:DNA-binding response OmpR family regulator
MILLVEDHESLGQSLSDLLSGEGYRVEWAKNLSSARDLLDFKSPPGLIVLDWMLPDGQGIDFLRQFRSQGLSTPAIFLTARADVVDKVLGLEMGASDYMTKPFEPRELLARIRARFRETSVAIADTAAVLEVGSLKIDRHCHRVILHGRTIELVKKEFELLLLLAESPGRVFSRDEILNKVWGYEVFPTTRTVDTHIMLLRQKVSDELIETVRAVGYRLKTI